MPKVTVKFKKDKAASEFAANFSILDDGAKVTVKGKEATVVSSNPRTVSVVKQLSKDVVEDIRYGEIADAMLSAIRESISGSRVSIRLLDGETQSMTPAQGEALARAYDRLSESNQSAFLILASEGREAFTHAIGFARKNEENE
jgi:hypothetical protein